MQYDVIIKGRTDFAYKNSQCYLHEQDYLNDKYENYVNFDNFNEPIVKTSGVEFKKYDDSVNDFKLHPEPPLNNIKRGGFVNFKTLNWKRDNNNFFRISDISQSSNNKAAEHFFKEHLNVYLRTFLNDYFDKKYITFNRHEAIQGDIAYYNNIKVYKTPCRYHRLVRGWDCKKCWNEKRGIIFPNREHETYEYINSQLQKMYEHKRN
jgi:hypothetical protein